MKQCFECGNEANHNHHVVPRSLGGTKTIPLCYKCHSLAHNNPNLFSADHSILIKKGLEKAKAKGKITGRPRKRDSDLNTFVAVRLNKEEKLYIKNLAKSLGKSMSELILDLTLRK